MPGKIGGKEELMNYQVLDVKVKDTEETAKLYTYFLDNSREIAPERVRPVIVICPGGGYEWVDARITVDDQFSCIHFPISFDENFEILGFLYWEVHEPVRTPAKRRENPIA